MNELRILSEEANDILIAGHIRPDWIQVRRIV